MGNALTSEDRPRGDVMSACAKSPRENEVNAHPFVRLSKPEIAGLLGELGPQLI